MQFLNGSLPRCPPPNLLFAFPTVLLLPSSQQTHCLRSSPSVLPCRPTSSPHLPPLSISLPLSVDALPPPNSLAPTLPKYVSSSDPTWPELLSVPVWTGAQLVLRAEFHYHCRPSASSLTEEARFQRHRSCLFTASFEFLNAKF